LEAVRETQRSWRGQAARPRPRLVPRWRALLAYLAGPLVYARSRFPNLCKSDPSRGSVRRSQQGIVPTAGTVPVPSPRPSPAEFQ
jgi:hypothetical protein